MRRQFVAVKFRSGDNRTYTYSWDGAPFSAGDEVRVPDRSGDGWKRVTVHEVSWVEPRFETKAVLGPYVPEDKPRDLLSNVEDEVQQSMDRDRE